MGYRILVTSTVYGFCTNIQILLFWYWLWDPLESYKPLDPASWLLGSFLVQILIMPNPCLGTIAVINKLLNQIIQKKKKTSFFTSVQHTVISNRFVDRRIQILGLCLEMYSGQRSQSYSKLVRRFAENMPII